MARYRPVSPDATWRDPQMSGLDVTCRYLELYFLSSAFANVIGCYQIVPAIVAAETGLTCDELEAAAIRLEQSTVIERFGDYVLVRRWFRHHAWETVLRGNVSKRAVGEMAALPSELQSRWIEACLAAGAPHEFVTAVCQPISPLHEASEGLLNSNNNLTMNILPDLTTTVAGRRCLILSAGAEQHRRLVEKATVALDDDLAQQVADELAGVLEAIGAGKRPPIGSVERWLNVVSASAAAGAIRHEFGPIVAKRREQEIAAAAREAARVVASGAQQQELLHRVERAELALKHANDDVLCSLVKQVAGTFPMRARRNQIADALVQRRIPRGPGFVEALAAIEAMSLGVQ